MITWSVEIWDDDFMRASLNLPYRTKKAAIAQALTWHNATHAILKKFRGNELVKEETYDYKDRPAESLAPSK
jgi:hypothetical protein